MKLEFSPLYSLSGWSTFSTYLVHCQGYAYVPPLQAPPVYVGKGREGYHVLSSLQLGQLDREACIALMLGSKP